MAALLPMCDLRPILGGEAARSPLPRWAGPAAGQDFVPWFGAVRGDPRRRGERACRADNAVTLLSWPLGPKPGPFRALQRDLSADGEALVRFDLAIGSDPSRRLALPAAAALARAFTRLSVGIPSQREREPIELCRAGNLLARAYLFATTPVKERDHLGFDWVVAGDPVFFVSWSVGEALSEEALPPFQRFGRVAVARAALPAVGPRSTVWFLRHDGGPEGAREVAELRAGIADLCARREGLRAVLTRIVERSLSPPPNPPRPAGDGPPASAQDVSPSPSDRLQSHLQRAVRAIERRERGVPVWTGQRPAAGSPEVRDAAATFVTRLDAALAALDVRGNIRRSVTAWARGDSAASDEPEPVLREVTSHEAAHPQAQPAPPRPPFSMPEALAGEEPTYDLPPTDELPAAEVTLAARLAAVGRERVDPGEITTFVLDLRVDSALLAAGPAAASDTFTVAFQPSQPDRRVLVTASSRDFVPLPGSRWEKAFVLRRDGIEPATWSFEGQAFGDRPLYTMLLQIAVDGVRAGGLQVQLPRRGSAAAPRVEAAARLASPTGPAGASLVVTVDHEGPALVVKWMSQDGEPQRWPVPFDPVEHFRALGSARLQERRALHDYCKKLLVDMNKDLFGALKQTADSAGGVLVVSPRPMLPFELLPLGRKEPFLGVRCPVVRWVSRPDVPVPRAGLRAVGRIACIRPEYDARRALPSAAAEEDDLRAWLAGRSLPAPDHVGDRAAFDALLEEDVDLLHFAGHAEDQPPTLHLPDKDRITPEQLWDTPIARNRPLFFLNGCRAGMSHGDQPPSLGGMIESLLGLDFTGVVAPFLSVDSRAARQAAQAFYEALGRGETVAQAVRAIHACAETDPEQAATYMSYLAYVPPDLRIAFRVPAPKPPREQHERVVAAEHT
jgi:hypothetical protein